LKYPAANNRNDVPVVSLGLLAGNPAAKNGSRFQFAINHPAWEKSIPVSRGTIQVPWPETETHPIMRSSIILMLTGPVKLQSIPEHEETPLAGSRDNRGYSWSEPLAGSTPRLGTWADGAVVRGVRLRA
jgi:hypothetical protein